MLAKWWLSLRPFSFTASIIPVLLGATIGAKYSKLNIAGLIITLVSGLSYHIVANLFNSYYDWQNGYDSHDSSKVIPLLLDKNLGPKVLHGFSMGFLIISIGLTLLLGLLYGIQVFLIGCLGILGAYFYTAPPLAYKYRGWSLPAVFIFMGLLLPISSYMVQTGSFNSRIVYLSLPLALLVTAILQVNELRDYRNDLSRGGRTFTILFGRELSIVSYHLFIFLPYLLVSYFSIKGYLTFFSLVTFLTLKQAVDLSLKIRKKEFDQMDVATAKLQASFGLLYLISFIIY